jgi:GNAT superfamily N-acetyltransferase
VETVRVRPAEPGDAGQIRVLGPRLAEGAAPWRPADAFAKAAQGWLDDAVDALSAERPVWVAEHGGRVVGVVAALLSTHFTGEQDCYLGELAVAADFEGRGVGRALVAVVERWALERGVTRVTLETGGANRRARAFYAALGYAEEQVQLTKTLDG